MSSKIIKTARSMAIIIIFAVIGFVMLTCTNDDNGNLSDNHNHLFSSDFVIEPTCVNAGYTTQTCSHCPETRQINSIPATGVHHILNSVCVICNHVEIIMAQIQAGTLIRYNPIDFSQILLDAFKIGISEITQEQYQAVMGYNPSSFHGRGNYEQTMGEVQSKRPVEQVTWFDAVEFCNKLSEREGLTPVYTITERTPTSGYPITDAMVTARWISNGYRLPTEAEWEFACRAGSTTARYYGGNDIELINYAWYFSNSDDMTHEVGKKLPNAFGLYDMYGNANEWCWDLYGDYPMSDQSNYIGLQYGSERVIRGGFYNDSASNLLSAVRDRRDPKTNGGSAIGFRVVRP